MKLRQVLRKEWSRWLKFMRKDFLKIFTIYAAISIAMVLIFMLSQQVVQTDLDLKPTLPTEDQGSFFLIALVLLPFTLLLEDLGMRLLPWIFLKPLSRMDVEEKRSWRIWLYLHVFTIYIVVSALWNSCLHQSNIIAANSLGIITYFGIHLIAGSLLAWIFIKKGFWQSYTIHVSWDFFLIGITTLSLFL